MRAEARAVATGVIPYPGEPRDRVLEGGCPVGEVGLRHDDGHGTRPQGPHRRHVLLGLGGPPLVGRDDEQDAGGGAEARDRRADEPVVAGDVDERHPRAVEVDPGVPELDGHAAATLLRQPVRVGAGEGAHEGRLAVVDVTRGRDDGHVSPGGRPPRRARP